MTHTCPYCDGTDDQCICQMRDVLPLNKPDRPLPASALVPLPDAHTKIRVVMKDGIVYRGTYRARVAGPPPYSFFSPTGTHIWVTDMFEHFVPIRDISYIEEV